MNHTKTLGQIAYEGFCSTSTHKPVPWPELPKNEQQAFSAAADAVARNLKSDPEGICPNCRGKRVVHGCRCPGCEGKGYVNVRQRTV